MKPRSIIALCTVAVILIGVAGFGFLRRQHLKQQYGLFIEEATVCISINHGSADDLEALPGIGPRTAQSIIEYRETHGSFQTLDDLKRVKGIGDAVFDRITPYIKL